MLIKILKLSGSLVRSCAKIPELGRKPIPSSVGVSDRSFCFPIHLTVILVFYGFSN